MRGSRNYRVDLEIEGNEIVVHCDCPAFEREPLQAYLGDDTGRGRKRTPSRRPKGPLVMVPDSMTTVSMITAPATSTTMMTTIGLMKSTTGRPAA